MSAQVVGKVGSELNFGISFTPIVIVSRSQIAFIAPVQANA